MAVAMIPAKHLDDISECPICRDSYSDPRTLPCIHTFCFECIRTWFSGKRPKDQVNCPLCRNQFRIPSRGLGDLPKNFFVSKLLAIKELSNMSAKSKACGWCTVVGRMPSERAHLFCPDCREFLCDSCSSLHTVMPKTRQHSTQNVDEKNTCDDSDDCLSIRCDKHPDKYLELYCSDCKETMCTMCFLTRHRDHKPTDVKEVVNEVKSQLITDISLLADGKERLFRYLDALHDRRMHIYTQARFTDAAICEKADRMKKMINHQKDQLLLEVNQLKDSKVKAIRKTLGAVTQRKDMIAYLTGYSQEMLRKGSYCDIARDSELLISAAEELAKRGELELVFNTSAQLITSTSACIPAEVSNNMVGEVKDFDPLAVVDSQLFVALYDTATFCRVCDSTYAVTSSPPTDIRLCPICWDYLTDPRMLPCIHTFCLGCIAELTKSTEHLAQNYVECPLCRKVFEVSDILNLPKNLFICKLLVVDGLSSSVPKKCGWCIKAVNRKKSGFCLECLQYLCDKCFRQHSRMPRTRQHRALSYGKNFDYGTAKKYRSSRCDEHQKRDLEIYCYDCKDTVCPKCFVTQHSGHKSSDVKEVANALKNEVNGKIPSLMDGMEKLHRLSITLRVKISLIDCRVAKIEEEISAKTEELIQKIDLQKNQLLFEVDQRKVEKIKTVDNAISCAVQNMAMVDSLVKYGKELLDKGSHGAIMRESKSLANRAKELTEICDDVSVLNTSQQMITFISAKSSDVTNLVGKVEDNDIEM